MHFKIKNIFGKLKIFGFFTVIKCRILGFLIQAALPHFRINDIT